MELLVVLLVLLVVTRLFGELAIRLGQAALVGELVSGIVLGMVLHAAGGDVPILAGLSEDRVFLALTDLAVFFLMLLAGIEMHPRTLVEGSGGALIVAVGGMLVPLGLGCGLGWLFLPSSPWLVAQMMFLGTALAVTAVPVSVRVLMDLGKLDSRIGRTIVSAAIFDNALSLVLLAVLTALLRRGELPEPAQLLQLGGQMLVFFAVTVAVGVWVLPRLGDAIRRLAGPESEFTSLVAVALGYAVLAEALSMHFILGAFLAGLFFSGRVVTPGLYEDVKGKISGLTSGFLAPLFFASIGLHLDLEAVTRIPFFLVCFVSTAFLGKVVGAGGAALASGLPRREALSVGVGMSARATVELIIAEIALRAGLFDHPEPVPAVVDALFSAVVVMAVVSSVAVPLLLKQLVGGRE